MSRRRTRAAVAAFAALAGPLQAPALATTGPAAAPLQGAPFAAFTAHDREIFLSHARLLAQSGQDGAERRWANDGTGAWGTMTLRRTWQAKRGRCRELRGANTAAGRTDAFRVVLCAVPDGEWRVRSSGPVRTR